MILYIYHFTKVNGQCTTTSCFLSVRKYHDWRWDFLLPSVMTVKHLIRLLWLAIITITIVLSFLTVSGGETGGNTIRYGIVPHFMEQPEKVDEFYRMIQFKNTTIDKVIVIAPDHFRVTTGVAETICSWDEAEICYKKTCVPLWSLQLSLPCFDTTPASWGKIELRDHGIGEHLKRIDRYLSGAAVVPILVQPRSVYEVYESLRELARDDITENVLVLASVDFSHYIGDNFGRLHDTTTTYVLSSSRDIADFTTIEADCPACLYTISQLARGEGLSPVFRHRDSSSKRPADFFDPEATSRQFIYYTSAKKKADNGLTVAFFGDFIYTDAIKETLPSQASAKFFFEEFYQQKNILANAQNFIHRPLFGIDFVWFAMEGPIAPWGVCSYQKGVRGICSDDTILPVLQEVWFSVASITNNHTLDNGKEGVQVTKETLEKNWITPFGTVIGNDLSVVDQGIYKGTKRWISYARHGFDFTETQDMLEGACKQLEQNAFKDVNLVSVHRGNEFQTTHDASQQYIGRKLIDCGADVIIGHHPHVPQDIERYKKKPIIYSLGNFLFDDQKACEGRYVLLDIPFKRGKVRDIILKTGTVKSCPE